MNPFPQKFAALWQRDASRLGRVADVESEFIEMTDSTRRGPSIYGVKTTKTKRRGNIVKSFALIAWITLATAEAQNIAPTPTRLSMFGMQGQPTAPTRELPALPVQQPIQRQIIQRSSATDAARYLAGMPVSADSPLTRVN